MKEDELEFISVDKDEESMNQSYGNNNHDSENNQSVIGSWLFNQSKHQVTIIFHFLFKSLALFIYIFGSWFTTNFIFTFVLCIIFLAFDFWIVKNISGRLLVGLRWWSYVHEDGSNEWIFESLEDMGEISALDSKIFWWTLYIIPLIWTLLLVIGLLRLNFEYFPIMIAAISMNMANTVGYYKCSSSAKSKSKNNGGSNQPLDSESIQGWLLGNLLSRSNAN